ncbi:MAG: hypothetical protein Q9227_005799 [Pyrenula ochraceoflavens]
MADANGTSIPNDTSTTESVTDIKGKGKAVDQTTGQDTSMEMDDDSSEESGNEEQEVADEGEDDEEEDDAEIDAVNIMGSRTRGKQIDYAAAEQEAMDAGEDLDEEDEEDDEDFEDEDDNQDAMEE